MAEVQDDEKWLYGDDKENENREKASEEQDASGKDPHGSVAEKSEENLNKDGEDATDKEDDAEKKDGEESSSDDDEPTVTIGKLVKQPDIIRPPAPTHRAAPTTGLKEDDFTSVGKINGLPLTEFNLNELEDTPWRKPGADISDYFNYGFNENTWNMYCDRQRKMRVSESGVGMGVIGNLNMGKPMHSIGTPTAGMNTSKYGHLRGPGGYIRRDDHIRHDSGDDPNKGNTIQVMTADRRIYSAKAHQQPQMESYVGSNTPYGEPYYHGMGPPPPSTENLFSGPPPNYPPPPQSDAATHPLNVPPPGYNLSEIPPSSGQTVSLPGFEPVPIKQEPEDSRWSRSPESRSRRDARRRKRSRSGSYSRRRRSGSRSRRSRSRSRRRSHSRMRRSHSRSRRSRSRTRSKSPSHRHRRKKSKRDREED